MRDIYNLLEQELTLKQFIKTVKDEEIKQLELSDEDLEEIAREYEEGKYE